MQVYNQNEDHDGMDTYTNSINQGHTPEKIRVTAFVAGCCLVAVIVLIIVMTLSQI